MITLIIRFWNLVFGKITRKIRLRLRRRLPALFAKSRPYKSYRTKFKFSDRQIIIYIASMIITTVCVFGASFYLGKNFVANNMFFIVIPSLFIVLSYEFIIKTSNMRKLDILRKKKKLIREKVDEVFVADFNDSKDYLNSYEVIKSINLKISDYFDYEHEAKLQAIDYNCHAVISNRVEEGYFRGYIARKIDRSKTNKKSNKEESENNENNY